MVFKFSNNLESKIAKRRRKIEKISNFSNKIVFVNGFSASGKTMISPIISSIEKTESTIYPYEIEWVAALLYSDDLSIEGFKEFIKNYCDHTIYNQTMGRNSNFRYKDISTVLNRKDFFRYFFRLFKSGDNIIPDKIKKIQPISCFTTSHLIFFVNEIFQALNDRCLFIETVRDPIYMFKQIKILFNDVYKSNPQKLFSFLANSKNKHSLFFDFYSNDKSFVKFKDMKNLNEICVNYLDRIFNFYLQLDLKKIKSGKSKFILLPFEEYVIEPKIWNNAILKFLKKNITKQFLNELTKQNIPRKILTQGISRSVYKRYGHNPSSKIFSKNLSYDEADKLYIEEIKKLFHKSELQHFDKLLQISNRYRGWKKKIKNFII